MGRSIPRRLCQSPCPSLGVGPSPASASLALPNRNAAHWVLMQQATWLAQMSSSRKLGFEVCHCAASGDSGANGRTDGACTGTVMHASFPGSSPYITAVGATQFPTPEYNLDTNP